MGESLEPGEPQVGAFQRGTAASRFALARYLVARVVMDAASWSLLIVALAITAVAALIFFLWLKWLGVLVFLVALVVLAFRAAFLGRLTGPFGPVEDRVRGLIGDSRGDLRRELKRIGLPAGSLGLPLLAWRLTGRRRADTMQRLRQFDVARVVPPSRLDELHLALQPLFPPS